MKQQEKQQKSREKILLAAIREFGTKSYEAASINNICGENQISKGLIYHYFENKDALYLCCVKACFDKLTDFLARYHYDFTDAQKGVYQYLAARRRFFQEYPYESYLFFSTIFQPPVHLTARIKECRKDFGAQGIQFYKSVLRHLHLRENITEEDAVEYFLIFQEVFHTPGRYKAEEQDFHCFISDHEMKLSQLLNIMLYGIAKEGTES